MDILIKENPVKHALNSMFKLFISAPLRASVGNFGTLIIGVKHRETDGCK